MLFQTLTLSVIGMFFLLAATENPPQPLEETKLGCSCKKKKKSSFKEDLLLVCEGHDEPLEEETV